MKCPEPFVEIEPLHNLHSDALRQDACGRGLNNISLHFSHFFGGGGG